MPSTMIQLKQIQIKSQTVTRCHRNHLYAQMINNVAASCIDAGEYDKGVAFLVKALCLSRVDNNDESSSSVMKVCACSHCSLDECIAYSEERAALGAKKSGVGGGSNSKKRKIGAIVAIDDDSSNACAERASSISNDCEENEMKKKFGYIHRRPILVTPKIISEGHIMGPILSMIVTFNLALANHLKFISEPVAASENTATNREKLRKVLRLYELAYKWEGEFRQQQSKGTSSTSTTTTSSCDEKQELLKQQQQDSTEEQSTSTSTTGPTATGPLPDNGCGINKCSSLRFDMIVCNNLSTIHRMAGNHAKQEKCLQHLLSILMFVIDWQRERTNYDRDDDHDDDHDVGGQQQPQEHEDTTPLEDSNECTSMPSPLASFAQLEVTEEPLGEEHRQQQQQQELPGRSGKRKRSTAYMDSDGFWDNLMPFLLKNDCAEAA